jgi:hypothetical protein
MHRCVMPSSFFISARSALLHGRGRAKRDPREKLGAAHE